MPGGTDWDRYWRYELFRRSCDPLDFRKWKRDSQRELAKLHPGALLLDSTAGLGDHTINLAEEGFRVEACDASEVAIEATREALAAAKLDVPVFRASWSELGRAGRYDVVFNDALHWIYDEAELRAALAGLFGALRPGGALVFFFADAAKPHEGAGLEIMAWDIEQWPEPTRLMWEHERDERTSVSLTISRQIGDDFIDEHHRYRVRDHEGERIDELILRRVYRWDWYALSRVLRDIGFVDLRSDHFRSVKGHTFAMSRAFRP
jgi:SAM-dependent methyltransferase